MQLQLKYLWWGLKRLVYPNNHLSKYASSFAAQNIEMHALSLKPVVIDLF